MATVCSCNDPDLVDGTEFADRLFGGPRNQTIRGLDGNDKLFGMGGKDMLVGGADNDVLTGDNEGGKRFADVFVFGMDSGKDLIADFDVNRDMLQIQKGLNGIKNAKDVLHHATQKGDDVVIDLGGGNKITLKNVDLKDLKKDPGEHFDITNM